MSPIVAKAEKYRDRIAIMDEFGEHTYAELIERAGKVARFLLHENQTADLNESRVAFLTSPDANYVSTLWGIWLAGGVTVPLSPSHPFDELKYFIENSESRIVVTDRNHRSRLEALADCRVHCIEDILVTPGGDSELPHCEPIRRANILYTSGTTSRPKGVVMTHRQFAGQIETLVEAWKWTKADRTLNVLPLHHTHGLINVVGCSLYAGAALEMQRGFAAEAVWRSFLENSLTVFMAVPTIYHRLLQYYRDRSPAEQNRMSAALREFRLMVSGSAALPVPLFEEWQEISDHRLLERYGMTEIGMALSNPYRGERRPGHVGQPLPGVEIRLADENMNDVAPGEPGQILVRGPNVFSEYWRNPRATENSFHGDWFCTGDIACLDNGSFRILGRDNIDIIKSGGYKISALEIESVLRSHPKISEVAVVGWPDDDWGERAAAFVVDKDLTLQDLRDWAENRLAKYKLPSLLYVVDELPKNAMGKVNKKELLGRHADRSR